MIIVAQKLCEIALEESNPEHRDLFGRSAFNRFYYASYLTTRDMLKALDPKWTTSPHKKVPDLLCTTIARKIKGEIRKQSGNLISQNMAKSMEQQANRAIKNLAELLEKAYKVRCVADYDPDQRIRINTNANLIELFGQTSKAASNWPIQTNSYTKTILKIWKDLELD